MANTFRINSSELAAQHRANIAASLSRRLEAARAAHNTQLVALLEQERRQLLPNSSAPSWMTLKGIKTTVTNWFKAIADSPRLSVEQVVGESGEVWWQAYDHRTGKTLFAETEAEVVAWIEENNIAE